MSELEETWGIIWAMRSFSKWGKGSQKVGGREVLECSFLLSLKPLLAGQQPHCVWLIGSKELERVAWLGVGRQDLTSGRVSRREGGLYVCAPPTLFIGFQVLWKIYKWEGAQVFPALALFHLFQHNHLCSEQTFTEPLLCAFICARH